MSLGTMEQRTEGMKRQAQELIEQAYNRGYNAGYDEGKGQAWSEEIKKYEIEPEKAMKYIKQGQNEAWEAVKKLHTVTIHEAFEILRSGDKDFDNMTCSEILCQLSASEAIEKIKAYEEKKQEEEEICVGDEIRVGEEGRNTFSAVVHLVGDRGDCIVYQCVSANGLHYTCTSNDAIRKTGRHFDEIAEVLKKLQEDEE